MSEANLRAAGKEWETNGPVVCVDAPDLEESIADPNESSASDKNNSIRNEVQSTKHKSTHVKWSTWINPLKWNPLPVPESRGPSRESDAGWYSHLTFHWVTPIMMTGYKRTLELNDLWTVNPKRSSRVLAEKLKTSFKGRVTRGAKRPLLGALYDTVRYEFLLGGVCQFLATMFQTTSPYFLKYLIQFADEAYAANKNNTAPPFIGRGIGWVIGILGLQVLSSFAQNHFLYRGESCGGETRAALMTVIFDKAMRISARAKAGGKRLEEPNQSSPTIERGSPEQSKWYKKIPKNGNQPKPQKPEQQTQISEDGWGNGRIINLMSVDTYRIDQASGFFHMLWTAPIQILVTLVLLLINLTYSALAGFFFLVLTTPLIARAIRGLLRRRIAINKITDQRITITQETLHAIRFVKFLGWESSFLTRIFTLRQREISMIQKLLATRNAINAVSLALPIFASMLTFVVFSVTNHSLNPGVVFSSLALFNGLRGPLNFLPMVIGQVVDAVSSVRRIQEFLLADDAKDELEQDFGNENAIELRNATFTWEPTVAGEDERPGNTMIGGRGPPFSGPPPPSQKNKKKNKKRGNRDLDNSKTDNEVPYQIQDISLSIRREELVAVIGSVGSGKSSLLAALAGDMRKLNGEAKIGATRSFCPQSPWIQNTTVRRNIVFGKEFNQNWYDAVIDASALRPDLSQLPSGDMTEIGERGINISGGQKQRLNIARAVYFDADIILLDDPLSAVDPHVGHHIMYKTICGLLKGKCRILATHQLHFLHRCDRIIWMEGGRIKCFDTYDNLMKDSDEFKLMLADTSIEQGSEKDITNPEQQELEDVKNDSTLGVTKGAELMTVEERAVKSLSFKVYGAYIKAAGGYWTLFVVLLLLTATQCSNLATSLWLSWWTANSFHYSKGKYIGIYAALGASQAIAMFLFAVSLSILGTSASKNLLRDSMSRIFRAPISFFDTTPLGRITNRFSRDVDTLDNNITDSIRMYFITLSTIISTFVLIIVYFNFFAAALAPLAILFLFAASFYRSSAREIKRFEAVARSDVFSRFSEAITGVSTIRAYGLQIQFQNAVRDAIDSTNGVYFLTMVNQRWLSLRLDMIGSALVFTVGILVVTSRFSVNPSTSGLVLSYVLSIVQMLTFTIRQLAEVENNMNSAERLHSYATSIAEEAPLKLKPVTDSWPGKGDIIFENVQMRYRAGLPLVLERFDLNVAAGERIGIVGRTGAGKSSVMLALFRIVELSGGTITIDGINIAKVGLQDLRSRLSIIPQDPTLFRGTIRRNLDPFDEHTDMELWHALRSANLVNEEIEQPSTLGVDIALENKQDFIAQHKTKINLETIVEEGGSNFSLGQRQLMALARALVRNSQIIVTDEATSSVDFETDQKIQDTLVEAFKNKTLLCIAHRLKTIISYDRIVVMDHGQISELGSPLQLFDAGGTFTSMCGRSGISREEIAKFHVEATEKTEIA